MFRAHPISQGLASLRVAAAAGVPMAYGSDLLGNMHRRQVRLQVHSLSHLVAGSSVQMGSSV